MASAYCGVALGDGGVLGITGEYLGPRPLEPRRARQPAHHRRHQSRQPDHLPEWRIPDRRQAASSTSPPACRQRDASSAAFGRGGIGSRRHSVAQFGRHVPGRLRAVHQRQDRRPLRHRRPPLDRSANGMPTCRRPTATTSMRYNISQHAQRLDRQPRPAGRWPGPSAPAASTRAASRSARRPPTSTSAASTSDVFKRHERRLRRRVPPRELQDLRRRSRVRTSTPTAWASAATPAARASRASSQATTPTPTATATPPTSTSKRT